MMSVFCPSTNKRANKTISGVNYIKTRHTTMKPHLIFIVNKVLFCKRQDDCFRLE